MTDKARIRTGFSVLVFKREDEPFSLRVSMLGPGAMTGFTPLLVRRNLWVRCIHPMRVIPLETFVKVRMAFFTSFGSYILFRLGFYFFLTERIGTNEGYRSE
jgi:hypothetical protein